MIPAPPQRDDPTPGVLARFDEASDPPLPADEPRTALPLPVNIRSASLVLIAFIASIVTLHWARPVFVPVMLGLMFSYALTPFVDRLVHWHLPRVIASTLVLSIACGGIGWTVVVLADDANTLVESMPEMAQKLRQAVGHRRASVSQIDRMQQAATELEKAAAAAPAIADAERGVTRVRIEKPRFDLQDYLWTGTLGFAEFAGQATVVVFLTLFLLATGNRFRRKMVKIAGPTIRQKKITIQALDEISEQVQRYLMVQMLTSVLVGVATWLAFWWIGVNHAAVWGLVAGILNLVPYVGAIAITAGSAMVGLVQFETLDAALLVAGVSVTIHVASGYLLTPYLTSRASRLSAITVFVSVLAWGWLWGIPGLLLGVPIMMAVKAVCDRIDDLKPIGELLGA